MKIKTIVGFKEIRKSSHYIDSDGYERWTEYDDSGHPIHEKSSDGFESWGEMNPSNPMKYTYTCNNGNVITKIFDHHGNIIRFSILGGTKLDLHFRYDEFGIPIECENQYNHWVGLPDNHKPFIYHYIDDSGKSFDREYDKNFNPIRYEESDGVWYKIEYEYRTVTITR